MSAAELANDLHAQVLELQGQVDALSVELAEKEAVIAKVRNLRGEIAGRVYASALSWVLRRLDGIDGL